MSWKARVDSPVNDVWYKAADQIYQRVVYPFRWLTVHATAVREPFVLSREDKARLFLLFVGLRAGRMQPGPLRLANRRLWLTKSAATFNFRMWPLVHAAAHPTIGSNYCPW